ncbi:PepSY-associated TM helix domain-containing protein [Zunongwangia sp. F260]|uniref:PepSY-associated TM helix domain-containing protein n=1 Tax=Autumnicola lenta TaxID=3075593 RepID=A0ABU3CIV9_9FLAO|nr:PepSY-associated TM helix domain-containing protein [Zunongwangia sp. F260]MDT0646294.1 PepSY-associated TM helix domain-containing protein [Zunongwangia sp. F260]
MTNRTYNILFHTHTVSGIIISVGLYIIFFAGSFSFFRDEIISWERNEPVIEKGFGNANFNTMMDSLDQTHSTYGRDISFTKYFEERRLSVNLTPSKDTTVQQDASGREFFYMDINSQNTYDYASNYSIGEFLYRLHFLAQLNLYGSSGYLLAGSIAFFFLFAIITGILVHWKKIVSNFFIFRPKARLKNIWTEAHTALGVIGLPFQFIYAVTGIFFIIATAIVAPPVISIVYEGDSEKMFEDLGVGTKDFPLAMKKSEATPDLNSFVKKTESYWPDFNIEKVTFYNFGDENMHVGVEGFPQYGKQFIGRGELVFNAGTGKIVSEKNPFENTSYVDGATGIMERLHFGDYGGLGLKIIYFILGIISCFVIISGILIWLVARDKKHITEKKRKFNAWLGWSFIAICLTMYPATAFTFVAVKLFIYDFDPERMTSIYQIFFYAWLVLILLFTLKKDNFFTNKYTLILGAILGLMIPVANGVISGNWFWKSFAKAHHDILFIDVFWIILALITFMVGIRLKRINGDSRTSIK